MKNLLEASKIATNEYRLMDSAVMELYAGSSSILQTLPFMTLNALVYGYVREIVRPSAGFRRLNEGFSDKQGSNKKYLESVSLSGGNIDIDTVLTANNPEVRTTEISAKSRAIALNWTRVFFKGDTSLPTQEHEFDGIQKRLSHADFDGQVIDNGSTSGGDPLSLIKLHELIDQVVNPTHLIMNKTMLRRLSQASRNQAVGGMVNTDRDELGRIVTFYAGLPILTVDRDNLNQEILPFSESALGGGSNVSTSIYCVSFTDTGLFGIQQAPLVTENLGRLDDGVTERTQIAWNTSFVLKDVRSAARLRGITNAPVVV